MSSGIVCKCGTELDLSDVFCRSCGAKKAFKVDPRITDEAWVEWKKYQKENPEATPISSKELSDSLDTSKSTVAGSKKATRESKREVKREYRDRNEVKKPKVHKAYKWWRFRRLLRNYLAFLLVVAIGYFAFTNAKTITTFVDSSLDKLLSSLDSAAQAGAQSAQELDIPRVTNDTSTISPNNPVDLYLTWPIACVKALDEFSSLSCGGMYSEANWDGNWWDDPSIRKEVCSSAYDIFSSSWPVPTNQQKEVPQDTVVYVFDAYSANPLVAASLVGIPEFKTATLSTDSLDGIDPEGYEMTASEAKERNYGKGFCVVHFQVQSMPDYQGSITVSLDPDPYAPDNTTWLIDGNEPSSRQFLFPAGEWMLAGEWMDDWEQIWDQNDYGSNPEVYLP